jgi:CheY-like chemotaxis protein
MPEGGSLTLDMANQSFDESAPLGGELLGDYVAISVADTGTGMAPKVLERVFEPFFTTKESGKGTGLGLSMVYGFARQSDGHVDIQSAVGEGTTIRIFLPRADASEKRIAARSSAAITPIQGRGETILVVEDDAKVRQVAVSTLQSLGFAVREAESGDAAIDMLREDDRVDLVLSDVKMPGALTGTDLARRLQQDWPAIKVLLTSGYVESEAEIAPFEMIYKPYRVADLAEKVHHILHAEQPALAAAS